MKIRRFKLRIRGLIVYRDRRGWGNVWYVRKHALDGRPGYHEPTNAASLHMTARITRIQQADAAEQRAERERLDRRLAEWERADRALADISFKTYIRVAGGPVPPPLLRTHFG